MGVIKEKDERDAYVYDASIKGGDTTFWAEVIGTIATDTTGMNKVVRVSSARLHSYLQHQFGEYEFGVRIPAAPGATTRQTWGLRGPKNDTGDSGVADTGTIGGGIIFSIDTNSVFSVISHDDFGARQTTNVTWDTNWDGQVARYQIRWEADHVKFLVNDSVIASHTTRVPNTAFPLELRNGTASNMDMAHVRVTRAGVIV